MGVILLLSQAWSWDAKGVVSEDSEVVRGCLENSHVLLRNRIPSHLWRHPNSPSGWIWHLPTIDDGTQSQRSTRPACSPTAGVQIFRTSARPTRSTHSPQALGTTEQFLRARHWLNASAIVPSDFKSRYRTLHFQTRNRRPPMSTPSSRVKWN